MACADCDFSDYCRCVRLRLAKTAGLVPPGAPRFVVEHAEPPGMEDLRDASRRAGNVTTWLLLARRQSSAKTSRP